MMGAAGEHDGESADSGRDVPGFGSGLATAAQSIIADARTALANPDLSDAQTVHELRKALKRWRAWLRLLAGPLGDRADTMRGEARELMRALAGARDAQAALDALADLRKTARKTSRKTAALPASTLSPASLATIEKRLTALRDTAEQNEFTPAMRKRLQQHLDDATRALQTWPLASISFDTIAAAMTVTYRRARKLMPDDWNAAEPESLHELRRRVVEHRHQMDLIDRGPAWGEEIQGLRNRLGACQDLEMLSNFTAPHQPLAPWRAKLIPAIAARRRSHLKAARRLAGQLFADTPKAFRKRIAALWARRAKKP